MPADRSDEARLTEDVIALARDYGRYGYRRIHALVMRSGWQVSLSVVERIWLPSARTSGWRREGLKVPQKQPRRRRLWFGDGSCIRLRPQHAGHVWSYDFVEDRTSDGRRCRVLNVMDEYSRESLAIVPARRFRSWDVIDVLADLFLQHGPPKHVRSDNGPEFIATALRAWLDRLGVRTLYIEPGSPWENGYIESFNARLRDELLNGEIFETLAEVRAVAGWWRDHYNRERPHSSLGYRPPRSRGDRGADYVANAVARPVRSASLRCASLPGRPWRQKRGSTNLDIGPLGAGSPPFRRAHSRVISYLMTRYRRWVLYGSLYPTLSPPKLVRQLPGAPPVVGLDARDACRPPRHLLVVLSPPGERRIVEAGKGVH